jgi:ribosomal protein S4
LLPQNFIIFLGLAPSQFASKILIQSGCIIINGVSSVKFSTFIKPGDIVQVLPQMINYSKIMFKYQQWSYVKTRLNYISFLQVDWALLMFSIIKWPLKYELIGPSFLSER